MAFPGKGSRQIHRPRDKSPFSFLPVALSVLTLGPLTGCSELRYPMIARQIAGFTRETIDDHNKEYMTREEAVRSVALRLGTAVAGCDSFLNSPLQMPLNWSFLFTEEDCEPYSPYECRDLLHVRKNSVESCVIAIGFFIPACATGKRIPVEAAHAYAYSVCSEALKSKWKYPIFFLP